MNRVKRQHPFWIVKKVLNFYRQAIFPILLIFVTKWDDLGLPLIVAIFIFSLIFFSIMAFISWKNNTYSFEGQLLWVCKGVLVKKKQGISLDQVTTLNTQQNLIDQILRLQSIKIDTGSLNKGNEISLLLSPNEAQELQDYFQKDTITKSTESTEITEEPTEKAVQKKSAHIQFGVSAKDLFTYAIISNNIFAGLLFFTSLYGLLSNAPGVEEYVENSALKFIKQFNLTSIPELPIWKILLFVLAIIILYTIFSFVISMIMSLVKYYGFQVTRVEQELQIEYGLFEKKKYIIPIHKIRAVYSHYALAGQIFKQCTLKIESIGYGDEKGEIAILYPVASEKRRLELIHHLLPDFQTELHWIRAPKKALSNYIIQNTLLILIIAVITSIFWEYGVWLFVLVILFFLSGILKHKKSAIAMSALHLALQNGGFTKTITILPVNGIQSITLEQNFLQRRKRVKSIRFAYQSNIPKSAGINFLEEITANEIRDLIYNCMRSSDKI